MASKAPLVLFALVAAAATFEIVAAQDGTAKSPFVWGRPRKLVGTPYASEIEPAGDGYRYVPVTTSAKNFFVRYNKTPHNLYLSKVAIGGKELGEVAPEEYVDGKVYNIPLAQGPGKYYISDLYKNYDTTENAYLPITETA